MYEGVQVTLCPICPCFHRLIDDSCATRTAPTRMRTKTKYVGERLKFFFGEQKEAPRHWKKATGTRWSIPGHLFFHGCLHVSACEFVVRL